jgi:hypothetical protein
MKIITIGQFFFQITYTKVFKITSIISMNFSSSGRKFKLRFEMSQNFKLEFSIDQFYCTL